MSVSTLKPIETAFDGYRFRSRLEARWAVFFKTLGVPYEYEKEGYDLGDGIWYLPDFWLPERKWWIEVKGTQPEAEALAKVDALCRQSGSPVLIVVGSVGEEHWLNDDPDLRASIPLRLAAGAGALLWNMFMVEPVDSAPADWGQQTKCPVCGFEYVHFGEPTVKPSDHYDAWQGRGTALRIPFWCENGHHWVLRFGFHKGNTYTTIEDVWANTSNIALALAGGDSSLLAKAYAAARSARFEHGEKGAR